MRHLGSESDAVISLVPGFPSIVYREANQISFSPHNMPHLECEY